MTVTVTTATLARKQRNIKDFTLSRKENLQRIEHGCVEDDLLDLIWNRVELNEWGPKIVK